MLLVGRQEGHPACKKLEWSGTGIVICLERDADVHVVQLMPLLLTVSCFSKIQIGFTFLIPADPGSPGKGPLNGCRHWLVLLFFCCLGNWPNCLLFMQCICCEYLQCVFFGGSFRIGLPSVSFLWALLSALTVYFIFYSSCFQQLLKHFCNPALMLALLLFNLFVQWNLQ